MLMRAKATIRLKFPSVTPLETLKSSLLPEVNKPGFGRANVALRTEGVFLVLEVEADDTVSLRSTLNAYLRWIDSVMNVVRVLDTQR